MARGKRGLSVEEIREVSEDINDQSAERSDNELKMTNKSHHILIEEDSEKMDFLNVEQKKKCENYLISLVS
ncbi:hypothetical protein NPIL_642861 [Nephila pilipes]|uniref:Uncharacterized protein n=1 Tax=Nephila pilipes TaxID=299642 RepID=A0A8X6TYX5_NEPPI|nr:hypothetical protein NPIL_642861 [Nephila pilipes]